MPGPFSEAGTLLIQTLVNLYLLAVIMRLLLQLVKADFYNPISQAIVKATDPLLKPLRRIIPGLMGIDMASIALALIIEFAAIEAVAVIIGYGFINPVVALIWSLLGLVGFVVNIFFFAIIASIIVSWVAPQSFHPGVTLLRQLTEPVMAPFRRLLPAMGGIDFSPILVFLTLQIALIFLSHGARLVGAQPALILGI